MLQKQRFTDNYRTSDGIDLKTLREKEGERHSRKRILSRRKRMNLNKGELLEFQEGAESLSEKKKREEESVRSGRIHLILSSDSWKSEKNARA